MKKILLFIGASCIIASGIVFANTSSETNHTASNKQEEYCVCTSSCQPGDAWCNCPAGCVE